MAIKLWSTFAVDDLARSRAFYAALGFDVRDVPGGAGITVHPDGTSILCIFGRDAFDAMLPNEICDTTRCNETITSVAADTREEVDRMVSRARNAGARVIGAPRAEPWGYGHGFADPDGHIWSVIWLAAS